MQIVFRVPQLRVRKMMVLRACSAAASSAGVLASTKSISARCLSIAAAIPASSAPSIIAYPRPELGSRDSQRARQNGLIPGIIYGARAGSEKRVYVHEELLRQELHKKRDTFLSSVMDLTIDGQRYTVLPRDLQMHPFRPKILSCNWLIYTSGKYPGVKLDLPLKPINEERCPAYKEGGWLLELMWKLPVYAHGATVPPFLAMDLRGKRLGDKIMASEISLGDGVKLRWKGSDRNFAVAKLVGSKRGLGDDADTADGAPAAGGAAKDAKAADAKPAAGGAGKAADAKPAAGGDKK